MGTKKVNTELSGLNDRLISVGERVFKLWLEFENTSPWEDLTDDFANIEVDLMDGRKYGISVCTFKYFQTWIDQESKNRDVNYQVPSDLYVKELTRECIELTISELLAEGELEDVLNESIFFLKFIEPWWDALDFKDCGDFLKEELNKELSISHPLSGKKFEILAKRQDNDDVLVKTDNGQLWVVHLTWSGQEEKKGYPLTESYLSPKDFWERSMKEDIDDFKE
ncbi:hypothetical protein [Fulvivirga sp.]|uniref:hypothetical protein n=1 Tax=Fulvivirga sp. TaxID=1931237 RepID=UPI0032F0481E